MPGGSAGRIGGVRCCECVMTECAAKSGVILWRTNYTCQDGHAKRLNKYKLMQKALSSLDMEEY